MNSKDWFKLSVIIITFYGILHFLGIGCPIIFLTGIPCAGCGMTRAWQCVLHLDFKTAFYYHPLFFIPPIVVTGMVFKSKIPTKLYHRISWFIIGFFITVYYIRLFNPNDTVVKINIHAGVIWKCINYISERWWGRC